MNATTKHSQAIASAKDYAQLMARGDYARAEEVKRTIDELVGFWRWPTGRRGYVWTLPPDVRRAMTCAR